jgi:hypothetical protein
MQFAKTRALYANRWGVALALTLILILLVGRGISQDASSKGSGFLPEQVLAELEKANAARTELSNAQAEWRAEQQKIELLLSTIQQQTRHYQAQAGRDTELRLQREKQLVAFETNRKRLEDIETMLDTLCERLEVSLAKLRAASLPGLIPPDRAQHITDPAGRLASAAGRIMEANVRCRNCSVELVVGLLDGEELTVKLLRAGGVAAWWVSLDGLQAGTGKILDAKLVLTSVTSPGDIKNINAAFNVIEGRLAPTWLLLPAGQLQVTPAKEARQ